MTSLRRRTWTAVGRLLAQSGAGAAALLSLLRHAQADDPRLCATFRVYVNHADGVGNDNPATNGEQWIVDRLLPGCRIAFDVGAHRGDWASYALRVNPGLALHCFEPSLATFEALASREFPASVRRNNVGLGAACSQVPLYTFPAATGLNSLYRRRGLEDGWGLAPPQTQETVSVITLDNYCASEGVEEIDYLKLDVEGHELSVLNGGVDVFSSGRVRYGQFEYGGCNIDSRVLLADFFTWFETAGYRLYKLFPDRLQPVPRYDQRLENFQYQNWLFARRDLPVPD